MMLTVIAMMGGTAAHAGQANEMEQNQDGAPPFAKVLKALSRHGFVPDPSDVIRIGPEQYQYRVKDKADMSGVATIKWIGKRVRVAHVLLDGLGQVVLTSQVQSKRYYQKNRERILAQKKERYHEDPERFLRENRIYRETNNDKILARLRAHYQANKEVIRNQKARYRQAHKPAIHAQQKGYREKHKVEIAQRRRRVRSEHVDEVRAAERRRYHTNQKQVLARQNAFNAANEGKHRFPFGVGFKQLVPSLLPDGHDAVKLAPSDLEALLGEVKEKFQLQSVRLLATFESKPAPSSSTPPAAPKNKKESAVDKVGETGLQSLFVAFEGLGEGNKKRRGIAQWNGNQMVKAYVPPMFWRRK